MENNKVVNTVEFLLEDIENERQVQMTLRQYLLEFGWRFIGNTTNKI